MLIKIEIFNGNKLHMHVTIGYYAPINVKPRPLPRGLAGFYRGFDSVYRPTPGDIDVKYHIVKWGGVGHSGGLTRYFAPILKPLTPKFVKSPLCPREGGGD